MEHIEQYGEPKSSLEYSAFKERIKEVEKEIRGITTLLERSQEKMRNIEVAGSYENNPQALLDIVRDLERARENLQGEIEILEELDRQGKAILYDDTIDDRDSKQIH